MAGIIKSIYESITVLEDVRFLLHFAKDLFPKDPREIDGKRLLIALQVGCSAPLCCSVFCCAVLCCAALCCVILRFFCHRRHSVMSVHAPPSPC
jgi:hypothetical protein